MSILVSRADMKIYVLQNADIVAQGDGDHQGPDGADRLQRVRVAGRRCQGLDLGRHGLPCRPHRPTAPNTDVLQRIDGAPDVMDVIRDRIKPGTVLVTTDSPAQPDTRSGSGFTVMDAPSS